MRETCNFHDYGHCVMQEEEEDGQNGESHFTRNTHVKFSLDLIFCIQFIFDMLSTVMSRIE